MKQVIKQAILDGYKAGGKELPELEEMEIINLLVEKVIRVHPAKMEHYAWMSGRNLAITLARKREAAPRIALKARAKRMREEEAEATRLRMAGEWEVVTVRVLDGLTRNVESQAAQLVLLYEAFLAEKRMSSKELEAASGLTRDNINKMWQRGRKLLKRHGASDELITYLRRWK